MPPFRVAADAFQSKHRPYFFDMLLHGCSVLSLNGHPTSVADVPLATLVAVYFCHLVTGKDNDGMSNKVDLEAARKEACAEMNETLAILPRLYKQKALTEEQMETFRSTAGQMKAWAKACSEPMSLGAIHAFARVHRVSWHTRVTGCNSVPLQIFLYLCEKRRLQVPQSSTGSGDYERLIGALLEDQRVAPYLLKDGRPTTVRQCIEALRSWCHQPTSNGETRDVDWTLEDKNLKMVERSSKVRNSSFLFLDIAANDYCVTKDMYARLSTKEGMDNLAGGTPLERYLVWEMGPPSCLKLEAALFKAVQKTSEWEELRVATLLNTIQNKSEWVNAVGNVLRDVLQTLPELESFESFGCFTLETSFQIALLKVVLNVSGHKETLKAALVNAFRFIPWWRNLYADSLLEWAMPKWQKIHRNFKIEILSRSLEVNSLACIEYLIPPYKDWNKGKETRNQVVGQLLEGFMEEARSILEEAYGDIER